jgi:hypothetical protein
MERKSHGGEGRGRVREKERNFISLERVQLDQRDRSKEKT